MTNEHQEGELLPCPFCGGSDLSHDNLGDDDSWHIECNGCDVSQHAVHTESAAITAWNTRARLDKAAVEPVPVDVERRKAIAGFNGCLKAKRGEFCQSCVGQATHYAYQDEDDRRKVPFTYPLASLPARRDLGLLGKPKEKR